MKRIISYLGIVTISILLQSCCNEGRLYVFIEPEDQYAFKTGDTLKYFNEKADTQQYVVSAFTRDTLLTEYQPDDCHFGRYSEFENITIRKINKPDHANTLSIYKQYEYWVKWNNKEYTDNSYQQRYDSLDIDSYLYKKVKVYNDLVFNLKFGVIQYKDTLNQTWTLKNPFKA